MPRAFHFPVPNPYRVDMNKAVISLGSNIDPVRNLNKAVRLLKQVFEVVKVTRWIRTAPIGVEAQADFFNGALLMVTSLEKDVLISKLKALEDQMGRDRSRPKFGPREIDLDVLLWNGEVADSDYHSREFLQVLVKELLDNQ